MTEIWEFYENMNEIVYVSDMETNEIIYMNKKTRKMYNLDSYDDYKHKKCHELFQGCSRPCAICTNSRLKEGEFTEWKYFNPLFGKTFMIKDTMIVKNGRRCRLEIAIDVTVQEKQQQSIKDCIEHEMMINEGLLIALSETDPNRSIEILAEHFGKAFHGERVFVFEETQSGTFANTYEWCADGIASKKERLQNVPSKVIEPWKEIFKKYGSMVVRNLEEIKDSDPGIYDILKPEGVNSLVICPLIYSSKTIGFFGIDNPPKISIANLSTLLQIMGHFIVSLLRRRDLFKKLEDMSYRDQLTNAGNRHAMSEHVLLLDRKKSLGIVYCDVTGLKAVNDTEGHQAGDEMLIRARNCIKAAFPEDPVFRIGGDEFLVICSGAAKEDLLQKKQIIQSSMKNYSVVIAVGCVWKPNAAEDFDKLLVEADELMYEDKKKYYALRK